MTERIPLFEEDKDYIDEDHISEFAKALIWQDDYDYDANTTATTDITDTTPINDEVPGIVSSLPSTNGNNKNKNKDINGTVSDSSLITDEDIMNSSYFDKPHSSTNLKSNSTKNDDDDDDDDDLISRPQSGTTDNTSTTSLSSKRPDLITSKSDWFPIGGSRSSSSLKKGSSNYHKKTTPTSSTSTKSTIEILKNEFRNSSTYTLLRWPILIFVFSWIGILGIFYFMIRIYVAVVEYLFTWRGERKRLRNKLRNSKTYEEWINNALELDKFLKLDKWLENPKFSYYDYKTIKLTILKLQKLRHQGKLIELMVILQGCLKKNFAGIENRQLYSHRYYGTKNLVEEYYQEVVKCLELINQDNDNDNDDNDDDNDNEKIDIEKKWKFFKIVLKNYGKSALCLSGGACFAYTHFGIAKALLDQNLLPQIISGTSGGGLIAALLCTRTNEELKKLLVPQLARKITACEDPWYIWIPRFLKTGARFDAIDWARKSNFFTHGSTTFEEAFQRTGRKLNISTIPADPHSPVILCNDITSPHCIIWSTLLASLAVPGILNPVVLMMKNPINGKVIPFSLGSKWRDGSLRTDIPIEALNTYYNVNFTIVSQVNPHISLFFFAPKGTVGRPVTSSTRKTRSKQQYASFRGGFIATALEQLLRLEIKKWLQIIKSLDLLPHFLQQDWLNIWLQNFTGTITIWPKNKLSDFWYILSDPTEFRMKEIIEKGEKCMFPRLLFIKHRASIENVIEKGKKLTLTKYKQLKSGGVDCDEDVDVDIDDEEEEGESGGVVSDYDAQLFQKVVGWSNEDKKLLDELDNEDEEEEDEEEEEVDVDDDDDDDDSLSDSFEITTEHLKQRRNTIF